MATKAALGAQLAVVADFENSKVSLEQHPTPSGLIAHLVHLTDLRDDIEGATVLDLGSGTGMLGLDTALRSSTRIVGIELDNNALVTAADSARRVDASAPIDWIRASTTRLLLCLPDDRQVTMLMDPPLGAQCGNEHADRAFLDSVASVADVSYLIHNEESKEFVESFITDAGGNLTDAFRATFDLDRQFDFHDEDRRQLDAEVFRTEWRAGGCVADRSPRKPPADTA